MSLCKVAVGGEIFYIGDNMNLLLLKSPHLIVTINETRTSLWTLDYLGNGLCLPINYYGAQPYYDTGGPQGIRKWLLLKVNSDTRIFKKLSWWILLAKILKIDTSVYKLNFLEHYYQN